MPAAALPMATVLGDAPCRTLYSILYNHHSYCCASSVLFLYIHTFVHCCFEFLPLSVRLTIDHKESL